MLHGCPTDQPAPPASAAMDQASVVNALTNRTSPAKAEIDRRVCCRCPGARELSRSSGDGPSTTGKQLPWVTRPPAPAAIDREGTTGSSSTPGQARPPRRSTVLQRGDAHTESPTFPPERRWTRLELRHPVTPEAVPAQAEIDPRPGPHWRSSQRFPRERGDGPSGFSPPTPRTTPLPPTRRWTGRV